MIEARRTLSLGEYRAEWAKPVLYARGANVRILEVASEVGSSMPVRHATLQTAKVGHSESESELFETTQTEERPISVFISYSHRDETLCAQLEAHLALLRRENRISIWNARQIRGGEAWAERVSENLRTADLVLLLVSADFMNSDYCYETEMRYALRRHNEGRTRVIPIVLRKCDWRTAEFAKLQALPKGGCPVMSWGDPDDAWTDVAKRLRAIVDERRASGGLREPKPRYPNERVCNWSRQLKRAYKRLEKVTIAGSGAEKVKNEIDELRYRLREGGLVAGDYLAGGRFTLIDTIGSGGFATVWKAYDRHRRMTVALKVLHAQYARDASRRQRFFRGARHMAELRHPGIVRVIEDKARDGRFHFFVMEFVDDADLYRAVRDGWCPDIDARLRLILEVGEALNFAHEHGVIHRDVKPQNVLIDGTRRARLTDFDLVRAIDSSAGTRTGSMLGTWIYAAPEMMSDAKEAGVAADIYGLGMTAVFAVYGRDLPSNVVRDAPGFVNGLDIDEQVRSVLAQAVAWEPAERFISVVDFCRALRESLVEPDSQPFSPNRVTSVIGGHRGLATTQQTRSKTTMTRRWTGRMNGERYLGNSNTKEVHDLDNEKTQCQIDEILQAGHEIPFKTLQAALDAGYDRGYWCLGGSKR